MKLQVNKLGGGLGIGFCLAGLVAIWAGWNGAATYARVDRQFPYLISGGLAGLALVVIGSALLVVQALRADRAHLEANLAELRRLLEGVIRVPAGNGDVTGVVAGDVTAVVAGPSAYHRPGCRLVEGRTDLPTMTAEAASAGGRSPCRICAPAAADEA